MDVSFVGLDPDAFLAYMQERGLLFDAETGQGAVFHQLNLLETQGKVGYVAVGDSHEGAQDLFDQVNRATFEYAASLS
jgi:hypothetical protein